MRAARETTEKFRPASSLPWHSKASGKVNQQGQLHFTGRKLTFQECLWRQSSDSASGFLPDGQFYRHNLRRRHHDRIKSSGNYSNVLGKVQFKIGYARLVLCWSSTLVHPLVQSSTKSCKMIYCQDPKYSRSEELLILLRDRPSLEFIVVSSNLQASLFLQDKLLESVGQLLIPVNKS